VRQRDPHSSKKKTKKLKKMKRAREEEESKVDGAPPAATITKEDAALYDRQIRLWGAASQQKIFEARVLVHGMTGVGAEIAKNLVLAGIGQVTVNLNVQEEEEEQCFLFFYFFSFSFFS
jgi:tRNA A37 threonylcarbamoyladenosine dehydratase